MNHGAANSRRMAEQPSGMRDIAIRHQLPNPGRRDALAVFRPNVVDQLNCESVGSAEYTQRLNRSCALSSEPKITTDKHDASVQRIDEDALNKFLGGLLR